MNPRRLHRQAGAPAGLGRAFGSVPWGRGKQHSDCFSQSPAVVWIFSPSVCYRPACASLILSILDFNLPSSASASFPNDPAVIHPSASIIYSGHTSALPFIYSFFFNLKIVNTVLQLSLLHKHQLLSVTSLGSFLPVPPLSFPALIHLRSVVTADLGHPAQQMG